MHRVQGVDSNREWFKVCAADGLGARVSASGRAGNTSGTSEMGKGNKTRKREVKKPKQDKKKAPVASSPPPRMVPPSGPSGS